MKLSWEGVLEDFSDLETANLPEDAVKFNEPNTFKEYMRLTEKFAILIIIIFILICFLIIFIKKQAGLILNFPNINEVISLRVVLLVFLSIIPHELLHAICFPKDAEVQIWRIPKQAMFVYSTYPISKRRFIIIVLLPCIIFAFIPFIFWVFMPESSLSNYILGFSFFSLIISSGDLLNVFNIITQMPKNSMAQSSGLNSYWFIPKKNN